MFTIIGSGFGLYGYLPALVNGLGETVALAQAHRPKVEARPELVGTLPGIRWVTDQKAALAISDSVVIATLPKLQYSHVMHCIGIPSVKKLVLEKPLADTSGRAKELLARAISANKIVRIGYTLTNSSWEKDVQWPRKTVLDEKVTIKWHFMANHFAKEIDTWKRRHSEGGAVLRFFGIHLVALLAEKGYTDIRHSALYGNYAFDEPERWIAEFSGKGLPDCHVDVNSRSTSTCYKIQYQSPEKTYNLVDLTDPFSLEMTRLGEDRRVSSLQRLLKSFQDDDRQFHDFYERVNFIWERIEDKIEFL